MKCVRCTRRVKTKVVRHKTAGDLNVCSQCEKHVTPDRPVVTFQEFQKLTFCNSKKLDKKPFKVGSSSGLVEVCGRREQWVGIGMIEVGKATGEEVLVIEK